jgi:hypothetical protein
MKRALIVILILAVAGGLFAQSFGGGVSSGLILAFGEDGHSFYTSKSDGGDQYGYYFGWGWTGDSGRVGGEINAAGGNGDGWNFDGSNIWFKPLDILTVKGGGGGIGGFGTPGSVGASNDAADKGVGVNLLLEPITGFGLGLGVGPADGEEVGKAVYTVGVKYLLSGLANIVANLGYNGGTEAVGAAFGVDVLALSSAGLSKLAVDVGISGLNDFDGAGKITVGPRIGFAVGDLSGGLRANIYLPMGGYENEDLNVAANANVSYPIGAITAGLGVGFQLKDAVTASGKFNPGSWDGLSKNFSSADSSVLTINPSISYKVAEAAFSTGYGLRMDIGGAAKMIHEIYTGVSIDF